MHTSFPSFARSLSRDLPAFAWQSWNALGLFGTRPHGEEPPQWVIDPEPLLIFTLEIARHDPRLFDELTDWLLVHEQFISTQRLANLLHAESSLGEPAIIGAVAAWIAKEKPRAQKWEKLAKKLRPSTELAPAPLFQLGHRSMPMGDENDPTFRDFGLLRAPFAGRNLSSQRLSDSPAALVLRLRALFGIDARSDVLAFLLTHDGGHAREIARRLAYSPRRIHEILQNLSESGRILETEKGHLRVFWAERTEWWDFLYARPTEVLAMPDWCRLLRGLTVLWRAVWRVRPDADAYVLSSAMRTAWIESRDDLINCEAGFHLANDRTTPAESFLPVFYEGVSKIMSSLATRRPVQ